MTASTPGPAEQAVAGQQVSRIVDDLARDHEDRFPATRLRRCTPTATRRSPGPRG